MLIFMNKPSSNEYIYEVNNQSFILDSSSQMFWFISENQEISHGIEQLKKYGFFKKKSANLNSDATSNFDIKHIVINPSFRCNLDCWYCYSKDVSQNFKEELSFEDIKQIILFFANYKKENNYNSPLAISMFFTSEITLDFNKFREVGNFINRINNKYNFDFYLLPASTNLVSVSDDFVNFVNEYGYINISVDIENKKQLANVFKNISKFNTNVIKHCIIPLNSKMENLLEIYQTFMKSFNYVSMRPVRVSPETKIPWTEKSIVNFKKEFSKLINHLIKYKNEDLEVFLFQLGPSDYFARFLDKIISRKKFTNRCLAGKNEIAIGCDKFFYPCSGLIGIQEFKVGSIEESLNFQQDGLTTGSSLLDNSDCDKCPIKYYCGGPCLDWLVKQYPVKKKSINIFECSVNLIYFELCSFFIYHISRELPNLIDEYSRKRGIENRFSYPLSFTDFVLFFSQ